MYQQKCFLIFRIYLHFFWLINKMNNQSSKLHFYYLSQDCSFCDLIKMKKTFKISFPKFTIANAYQNEFWNVTFKNENALAEWFFFFFVWLKYKIFNHPNCIVPHMLLPALKLSCSLWSWVNLWEKVYEFMRKIKLSTMWRLWPSKSVIF